MEMRILRQHTKLKYSIRKKSARLAQSVEHQTFKAIHLSCKKSEGQITLLGGSFFVQYTFHFQKDMALKLSSENLK